MSRKILLILILAVAVSAAFTVRAAAFGAEPVVRVGLRYGSGALNTANLQNVTGAGAGYSLGYFDAGGGFTMVMQTNSIKISMRAGGGASNIVVYNTDTNDYIWEYDGVLGVVPLSDGFVRPLTWQSGFYYAGAFEFRRSGENITVINRVGMEDYVNGVVPYEMGGSWPLEALKAQAVCARSYAYASLNKHSSSGFDVCTTVDCQVYNGARLENENTTLAVSQTRGQFAIWNGEVAQTFYHSSSGGSTEDVTNIWVTDLPYLRAVSDSFEDLNAATNGRWSYTVTNATLTEILSSKGHQNSGIVGFSAEYTAAGNILALHFVDSRGESFSFTKERARSILSSAAHNISIYSQRFTVNSGQILAVEGANGVTARSDLNNITVLGANGRTSQASAATMIIGAGGQVSAVPQAENNGTYVIQGTGWGHNVGMSQHGAKGMAESGYTYADIIGHYFTGVYIGGLY